MCVISRNLLSSQVELLEKFERKLVTRMIPKKSARAEKRRHKNEDIDIDSIGHCHRNAEYNKMQPKKLPRNLHKRDAAAE